MGQQILQIPLAQQQILLAAIGLAVATLAYLVGRNVLSGETRKKDDQPILDQLLVASPPDRRSDPRRKGNAVEVDLCDPRGRIDPFLGFVLDRSRGGIGLIVPFEVPIGTVLNVRPRVNQNPHAIPIEVRSCRPNREGFQLGCQFVQTPPWNILMLFG